MKIYYTAKDIEEMAAKGIRRLEIGPGITLTDFARETAYQFNIELVVSSNQTTAPAPKATPSRAPSVSDKYNKPSGCQHGSNSPPQARSQPATGPAPKSETTDSTTVNRLIDLMGKVIKRGE